MDPISGFRGGRGFDLPPASKFRSGHLPSTAIPVSRALPRDGDGSVSASDDDITTDSEEEDSRGRYSLDSSPVNPRIPVRNGNPVQTRGRYASDYVYSDVSSSRETIFGRERNVVDRLLRQSGTSVVYTEEDAEESDSAASSEFSTTQVGSISGASGMRRRVYTSEGYASSVTSHANVQGAAQKVCFDYCVI